MIILSNVDLLTQIHTDLCVHEYFVAGRSFFLLGFPPRMWGENVTLGWWSSSHTAVAILGRCFVVLVYCQPVTISLSGRIINSNQRMNQSNKSQVLVHALVRIYYATRHWHCRSMAREVFGGIANTSLLFFLLRLRSTDVERLQNHIWTRSPR